MAFYPLAPVIGNIQPPLPVAQGGTGAVTAAAGLADLGGLGLQASTGLAGYTLVNGTGNVITWTVPSDGAMHRVTVAFVLRVTVAETGGQIQITATTPDGGATITATPLPGGQGTGAQFNNEIFLLVQPGSVVTVKQSTALTVGAAVLWAEIWGL